MAAELIELPLVAVDLDECLGQFVTQLALWHNEVYNTTLTLQNFDSYHFCQVWGGSNAETGEKMEQFFRSQFFLDLPVVAGAREVLESLKGQFRFIVVTSRQSSLDQVTRRWLDKHYPGVFDDVRFGNHYGSTGAKMSKPELCKSIGAICLVDDSLKYCLQCAPGLQQVILFDWDGKYMWSKPAEMPHLGTADQTDHVPSDHSTLGQLHLADRDVAEDKAKHTAYSHGLPRNVARVRSWAEVGDVLRRLREGIQ